MFFYWLLFLTQAFWALYFSKPSYLPNKVEKQLLIWSVLFIGLALTIGLRHEVGADWDGYLPYVEVAQWLTLSEAISATDPGYGLLNWLGAHWGGGIYLVNLICGLIFSFGLIAFCRQLPRPWLAVAVAIPYLVIVVAMGYSRQAVAIGIAMWGLALLQQGSLWKFIFMIAIAALFHKSAIALILIALAVQAKHKFFSFFAVLGIGVGLYVLLLIDSVDSLMATYVEAEYQSAGTGVRIAMNALPSFVFLIYKKRFLLTSSQRRLWTYMAWVSLGFVVLSWLSPSSTAVDRLALYLIPIQLFVWAHFPDGLGRPGHRNLFGVFLVLGYYFIVLLVWLFLADHSFAWIPYKFYPFEML